jgi:hypothetical protein
MCRTRLVQWTRRWPLCLHLKVTGGGPLTSVVKSIKRRLQARKPRKVFVHLKPKQKVVPRALRPSQMSPSPFSDRCLKLITLKLNLRIRPGPIWSFCSLGTQLFVRFSPSAAIYWR